MTLKAKLAIALLLILAITGLSYKLFANHNEIQNSIVINFFTSGQVIEAETLMYRALFREIPDVAAAVRIAGGMPETVKPFKREILTEQELHNLIAVELAFARLDRLLRGLPSEREVETAASRQIDNELIKIGNAIKEFRKSFRQRTDRQMARQAELEKAILGVVSAGIVLLFLGLYRSFLRPILKLSMEVRAVRDGRAENITPLKGRDEIASLSYFTADTLGELKRSGDALSERYGMQYAVSEILKASQREANVDAFLGKVIDTILSIKWLALMSKGGIFVRDDKDPGTLILRAEKNFTDAHKAVCRGVPLGTCLCGKAVETGKSIFKPAIDEEHELTYEGVTPHGHYCVPIVYEGKSLGVIALYLEAGHMQSRTEMEFLETVSAIVAETLHMRRLTEREHLVTRAIEEAGEGIMIAGSDAVIEYVNPAIERITGYKKEELLGTALALQTQDEALLKEVMAGKVWSGILKDRKKDAAEYQKSMTVIAVQGRFVSIVQDITKERRLEEQLQQAQKLELVGRLAGGVAHDFNNYMSVVLGYGELAMDELGGNETMKKYVEAMLNAAGMASNLTKQLLTFGRRLIVRTEVLSLNSIIDRITSMLGRLLGENIAIEVSKDPSLWSARADPNQAEQVVLNLIVNARDAMPEGGKLKIATANAVFEEEYARMYPDMEPGQYAMLSVSDTGTGMTEEVKAHVFEPFFTTKEKGKGTGLGLATVYGIVKQSGGHIHFYSEPGLGTTFKIYLPRALEKAEEKVWEPEAAGVRPGGSETVLLAEDNADVRRFAADVLSALGYTVLQAVDGADALRVFDEHRGRIHLLLTDVVMPGMNGPELAGRLKEKDAGMKAMFMSGYADRTVGRLEEADILDKPFTASALARGVRKALDTG